MAISGGIKSLAKTFGRNVSQGGIGAAAVGAMFGAGRLGAKAVGDAAKGAVLGEFGIGGLAAAGALGYWMGSKGAGTAPLVSTGSVSGATQAMMEGLTARTLEATSIHTQNVIEAINNSNKQIIGALDMVHKEVVSSSANILGVLRGQQAGISRLMDSSEMQMRLLKDLMDAMKKNEYLQRELLHEANIGKNQQGFGTSTPGGTQGGSGGFSWWNAILSVLGDVALAGGAAGAGKTGWDWWRKGKTTPKAPTGGPWTGPWNMPKDYGPPRQTLIPNSTGVRPEPVAPQPQRPRIKNPGTPGAAWGGAGTDQPRTVTAELLTKDQRLAAALMNGEELSVKEIQERFGYQTPNSARAGISRVGRLLGGVTNTNGTYMRTPRPGPSVPKVGNPSEIHAPRTWNSIGRSAVSGAKFIGKGLAVGAGIIALDYLAREFQLLGPNTDKILDHGFTIDPMLSSSGAESGAVATKWLYEQYGVTGESIKQALTELGSFLTPGTPAGPGRGQPAGVAPKNKSYDPRRSKRRPVYGPQIEGSGGGSFNVPGAMLDNLMPDSFFGAQGYNRINPYASWLINRDDLDPSTPSMSEQLPGIDFYDSDRYWYQNRKEDPRNNDIMGGNLDDTISGGGDGNEARLRREGERVKSIVSINAREFNTKADKIVFEANEIQFNIKRTALLGGKGGDMLAPSIGGYGFRQGTSGSGLYGVGGYPLSDSTGGAPGSGGGNQGGGGAPSPGAGTISDASIPTEGKAFLDALSSPGIEGASYNTIVGGGSFSDFSAHPNKVGMYTQYGPSTAAGRYQFTGSTWREMVKKYPELSDFSPANQDKAAWYLARDEYKRLTGGDLAADLKSARGNPGRINEIASVLSGRWTSLPGGKQQGSGAGDFGNRFMANIGAYEGTPGDGDAMIAKDNRVQQIQDKVAGVRKGALRGSLVDKLNYAASEASRLTGQDIRFRVTSGGQRMPGAEGHVGTHEHDHGGAADFNMIVVGADGRERVLDPRNAEDMKVISVITREFGRAGGRSVGTEYMSDPTKFHFGDSRNNPAAYAGNSTFRQSWAEGYAVSDQFDLATWKKLNSVKIPDPVTRQQALETRSTIQDAIFNASTGPSKSPFMNALSQVEIESMKGGAPSKSETKVVQPIVVQTKNPEQPAHKNPDPIPPRDDAISEYFKDGAASTSATTLW